MKLTDFLISRQHGLSRNISKDNERIRFHDIHTTLEVNEWNILQIECFRDFISKYTFPLNEELSKTDRNGIRSNIPEPQVLIQKKIKEKSESNPVIAMYLYEKSQLAGDSVLHLRSINKFEQMWLPYFINFRPERRDNPKVHKRQFFEYCQSTDINFKYSLSDSQFESDGRVRTLSFAFNSYVLLMYVFDKDNLTQEELLTFIDNLKSST
ncbi:hypothetical protein [Aquiflexum gelatinilyticum]|uniref:Uncharacterized protein n=1 Tax=Aquiflexum gelatinilyticum TaxID=2961943 RepID=A0A9X2P6I6_9BACT|nr:hypothetical protein [Aquiflexum gelatinilyticum]MCR9017066.1 hypothetical protein [Aquiflexum gelatinilyticum]